jgi:hypothetical protein
MKLITFAFMMMVLFFCSVLSAAQHQEVDQADTVQVIDLDLDSLSEQVKGDRTDYQASALEVLICHYANVTQSVNACLIYGSNAHCTTNDYNVKNDEPTIQRISQYFNDWTRVIWRDSKTNATHII